MKNGKLFVIIGGIIIAAALTFTVGIQSAQNRAIGLEESVYTAESDIKVQEKARVDKVYNLWIMIGWIESTLKEVTR